MTSDEKLTLSESLATGGINQYAISHLVAHMDAATAKDMNENFGEELEAEEWCDVLEYLVD